MHSMVKSGGHSPKRLNGSSVVQLKSSSDTVQAISSSQVQVRGKKRDRGDQCSDPAKREHCYKPDDHVPGKNRDESMLKSEIAKITDRGGLVDFEGVEKLVKLMQPDAADKKMDLRSRILLVDVIAYTDRYDCLGRFVQHKGLPVLDEWLQEVHRGKVGDARCFKESDKSVEDFLLALLRALDKLPINLHALQTCNVGKSVNHLRTHKNSDIQKKARSLVDTWKKRVEAEMNMNDARSGMCRGGVSWPNKQEQHSDVSHGSNKKTCGSGDSAVKASLAQSSASRISNTKLGPGECNVVRRLHSPPAALKSAPAAFVSSSTKDMNPRAIHAGSSDLHLSAIKEERDSSSGHSPNNSQSCSSDQGKHGGSSCCREDEKSSTTGSATTSRSSGCETRPQKPSNGDLSSDVAAEKLADVALVDHGNNPRLVVRLPTTTAHNLSSMGGSRSSLEDATLTSCTSPLADKNDNHDRWGRLKNESLGFNVVSSLNSDLCNREGDGFGGPESGHTPTNSDEQKLVGDGEEVLKAPKANSSLMLCRAGKSFQASLTSIHALVESCVKFSEACSSMPLVDDDVGMNLLASVAAGEILKADSTSPQRGSLSAAEESFSGSDDVKIRNGCGEVIQVQCECNDVAVSAPPGTQCFSVDLKSENERRCPTSSLSSNLYGEKVSYLWHEEKKKECSGGILTSSSSAVQHIYGISCLASDVKKLPEEASCDVSTSGAACFHGMPKSCHIHAEDCKQSYEARALGDGQRDRTGDDKKIDHADLDVDVDGKVAVDAGMAAAAAAATLTPAATTSKAEETSNNRSACSLPDMVCKEMIAGEQDAGSFTLKQEMEPQIVFDKHKRGEGGYSPSSPGVAMHMMPNIKTTNDTVIDSHSDPSKALSSHMLCSNAEHEQDHLERKGEEEELTGHLMESEAETAIQDHEERKSVEEQQAIGDATAADASVFGSGVAVMLDFDLNEGISTDHGNQGDPVGSAVSRFSSMSRGFAASITVAAAAKGPFVLPENPLRATKGEFRWKGSAATSAFRPAEPRKLDAHLSAGENPNADNAAGNPGRPLLDIDLNVPDEHGLEDNGACHSYSTSTGGGFDFDLNRIDASCEAEFMLAGASCRFDDPAASGCLSVPPCGVLYGDDSPHDSSRDFDLNDGPCGVAEALVGAESVVSYTQLRSSLPFISPAMGLKGSGGGGGGAEYGGNFSTWFPPSNSYSAITVPSVLAGRGEHGYFGAASTISPAPTATLTPAPAPTPIPAPQRILAPSSGNGTFCAEMLRGPVLSTCPSMPFQAASQFQYAGLAFEPSFPFSGSGAFSGASPPFLVDSSSGNCGGGICFSTVAPPSGPDGFVSPPPYTRPYVMSLLPCDPGNVEFDSRKWASALDLNAGPSPGPGPGPGLGPGPGGMDAERREDRFPSALRQHSISSTAHVLSEDHLNLYQLHGALKRKEPDTGSWDVADRFGYKQSSWK